VVEDELAAAIEKIQQAGLAIRAVKDVVLVDAVHRLPAAFGVEGVLHPGVRLFPFQLFFVSSQPLIPGNDGRHCGI
jgi:hypothetical protein